MQRLVLLTLFLSSSLLAFEWNVRGQASAWNNSTLDKLDETLIGLRYIPEASLMHSLDHNSLIDADVSFNALGSYDLGGHKGETGVSLYRAWLRYSGEQFEARVGLQQIKFGPAMILRPLMWFDQLDPRDPLQFTKGVPAALVRYYFLNNANVWLWGVLGDDEAKGLEAVPSEKNSAEYGGRIQMPTPAGEIALTFHHRTANLSPLLPEHFQRFAESVPENRYALDGKWDAGIGLWFEGAIVHKNMEAIRFGRDWAGIGAKADYYQKYLTIGADYTFGLGNGLYLAGEHLIFDLSSDLSTRQAGAEFSALMGSYNVSLWDMVMGLFYYSWETQELFNFITWRRTYDNFSFNLSLFLNPETSLVGVGENNSTAGAGAGFQIMVVYNH